MSGLSKVLALDTALNGCCVCVYDRESAQASSRMEPMIRGQSEALVPLIQDAIKDSGFGFDDIDLIVTTRGPGAFTGLRIGLSTAKSLALALDIPLVGLTTLEILARQYLAEKDLTKGQALAALIETKREDFYVQLFDGSAAPLSELQAIGGEEILEQIGSDSVVMVGDAVERFSEYALPESVSLHEIKLIDPELIAKMGFEEFSKKTANTNATVEPLYLRSPDVSQPKTPPRILAGS